MKKYYSIGFFVLIGLFLLCLNLGYQKTYEKTMRDQKKTENNSERSLPTKGNAYKNNGYYLKELHGYVVVYFSDQETLFELTTIATKDLPENVQLELKKGKYVRSLKELYGFLENYSS